MTGTVRIGTSGWNYKHWIKAFYPEDLPQKEMLKFYAEHFDTVEINSSFYRLPELQTFTKWRTAVPTSFTFAVKASRFITHMKKLKAPKASTNKLFSRVKRLEDRLGPLLFQLPPRWNCDFKRLSDFLDAMPAEEDFVFEFRDDSWLTDGIFQLLRKHNVALCIHDHGGKESPQEITADFTYIRMHGPGAASYSGSYSPESLKLWAQRIKNWQRDLKAVYVYFNNDAEGHAVRNALQLRAYWEAVA